MGINGKLESSSLATDSLNREFVQDLLLHVLPLNHLHGIVVALLTTLWAGASVELWSKLDGEKVRT